MIILYKFNNIPGFGDNLRGLITFLQIQKKLKFELIVNLKESVFSKYLEYTTPDIKPERSVRIRTPSNEKDHSNIIIQEINKLSKLCNIVEISNTAYPKIDEIDDDIKNYIRNLLKLNPATVEYFENKCKDLPKNYNLIHYRLGDSYLINERPLEGTWVEHFKSHKKDNCVLISDSLEFKHQINDEFRPPVISFRQSFANVSY